MGLRMARKWAIHWQGPLLLVLLLISVVFGQIETETEVPELSTPDSIHSETLTTEASISLESSRNNDEGSLNSENDSRNIISDDFLNPEDTSANTDEVNENNNPSNPVEDSENTSESSTDPDISNNTDNDLENNVESYRNNGIQISELSSTSIFSDRLGEVNDDNFERPTNAQRVLQNDDGGWQPIVLTRQPTIRFPTLAPTISAATVTPNPTLIASSPVVSKVPISEYFTPDNFASGPLHSPEDLAASLSSSIEADTSNPSIPSSRVPELQSSVLTEPANGDIVTPLLTAWDIPNVTIVENPRSTIAPTQTVAAVETEVVGNALPESDPDSTTDALPPRFDLDFEDSSPDYLLPTGDGLEYITGSEDPFDLPLSTSKPTIPSDSISSNTALTTDGIPNTGEDNSDIPVTAVASDMTEDVTAVTSGSVDSIVSTTVAPTRSTVKASSRTPLWMLLSKTTPETPSESVILPEVTPTPEIIPSLVPTSTLISSLSLLDNEDDDNLESSSLLVTEPNDSSQEILQISSSIAPSVDFSTTPESIMISKVVSEDILTNSLLDDTYSSLTVNPVTTVQYSELVSSSISPTVSFTPIISETNVLTSSNPVTLSSSLSDSQSPDLTSTTPISLSDNVNESVQGNSSVESSFFPNIAIASTALSGSWGNSGEPIVVTVPEISIQPTQLGSIVPSSVVNNSEEVVNVTPVNAVLNTELDSDISVTWTPVGTGQRDLLESTNSILSTLVTSSSAPSLTSSSVFVDLNPEFTGGFTPIISEIIENSKGIIDSSETFTSDGNPSLTQIPVLTPATSTMTAPVSDFTPPRTTALIAPTTSLPSVQSPEISSESVVPFNPNIIESNINHFTTKSVIMTTAPNIITDSVTKSPSPTSTTPIFDIFTEEHSLPNSSFPTNVSTSASRNISTEKPMIIVTEKLPATPTVFIPVNDKSSSTSTAFFSPEGSSSTAAPDIVEVTNTPSISTLLTPSVSPPLLSPTVTVEQPIAETSVGMPVATTEAPATTTTTTTSSTTTEKSEVIDVEEISTELSTIHTTPKDIPITTTETTTTTTTTTQRPIDTASTTQSSTDRITSVVSPTDSMKYPTTTLVLSNGSSIERPVPYIRAEVDYSPFEFCDHKIKFRTMLSQWITQHLQQEIAVSPEEIEFFNMPDCSTMLLKEPNNDVETSELAHPTNVFFYVKSEGKIDPSLTEKFPINPRELDLPQELHYLREMVTQLELIPVEDNYWSDDLQLEEAAIGTSIIVIIVIATLVGLTIILGLVFFMIVKRRGSDNNYYGRRCTPVSMDAYSMDSVSVYHSFRRKSKRNKSSRSVKSYLNQAFDDPNGPSRPLNFAKLTHFISDIDGVHEEFSTIPVNMPKYDEMPQGVEDKNRYANVIPVPETRVTLKAIKDSNTNSEYINANYVRGPRSESKYYIATQAPLDETVQDFWRMIWEQETRVIVMMTDFVEKGIDKCADYLPPSETLDCHRLYGDFQVTLKSRDMREKYVVSNVQLKNLENNLVREIAHMWYTGWPAAGVPNEEGAYISFILEIRRTRKKLRAKGPIVVHCSPGTGRTGTFLSCDLCMRQFEEQRSVDIPRTVYAIRRDRAGAVQTKEQYAFIYRTINLYASKLTTGNLDSL